MPAACQLELIAWENPLGLRIGSDFFRELPEAPGVYRMLSREAEVLYVGSSRNLRNRVGSYRSISPVRHPKRLCRLVHAARAIHIELTASESDARELEASWIRHYRPLFNRALNRPLETIWIGVEREGADLITRWTNSEKEHTSWPKHTVVLGPCSHRKYVSWLQSLRRTLEWIAAGEIDLRSFPCELLRWEKPERKWKQTAPGLPKSLEIETLSQFIVQRAEACSEKLTRFAWNRPLLDRWEYDREILENHSARSRQPTIFS